MKLYFLSFILLNYILLTNAACYEPIKFYVDCGQTRSASQASLFCQSHGMTMVNLTNGTASLTSDIILLNNTFKSINCNGYFWFSSGSQTGLVTGTNSLGELLVGLVSNILNLVLCLIPLLCPASTTAAPITQAFTVCTRPVQQRVIQKCLTGVLQTSMRQFRFTEKNLTAGIFDQFPAHSLLTCSSLCSQDTDCVGLSYINSQCTLYM